uniref:Uncharacterized protein n=1 Tax=Panagrolaimus davidi TaxID=227884 RepID=A0A914QE70_9BILA
MSAKTAYIVADKECYNMSAAASIVSKNDSDYFAYIRSFNDRLQVIIYGCQSGKFIHQNEFTNINKFIANVSKIFDSKIKAIILQVFGFTNKEYPNNIHFCEALKAKLDACKIPYYFMSNVNMAFTAALTTANVSGENVTIINSRYGTAMKLEYTENGYILGGSFPNAEALVNSNDIKIVLVTTDKNQQRFMKMFKLKNPVLIDTGSLDNHAKALTEVKKWMSDKTYKKFHVIPMAARGYCIGFECDVKDMQHLRVDNFNVLPFIGIVGCSKTSFNQFIAYRNDDKKEIVKHQMFKLNGNAHGFNITLKIDINNFPTYEVENVIYDHIVKFPKFCDVWSVRTDLKAVIGILANYSFICINKNGKFEFLESWGGQWGDPIYISFDKKKPQFGKVAEEIIAKHGKYGVQDLILIMSEGSEAPTTIPERGYTFTKDDENPILLEFETFDGTKKSASPEFLMAMLIRQQLKAIEAEIGKKPVSIGFCIFNDLNEKQENNLQNALGKACELMKIKDFCFVPWK